MKRLVVILSLAAALAGCASTSEGGGRFYTGAYGGLASGAGK